MIKCSGKLLNKTPKTKVEKNRRKSANVTRIRKYQQQCNEDEQKAQKEYTPTGIYESFLALYFIVLYGGGDGATAARFFFLC